MADPEMGDTAIAARRLIRTCRSAALATAATDGHPFVSLVTVACDQALRPLLLLSGLADHSKNIAGDNRASLLFEAASGLKNPQTGPRVSVVGTIAQTFDPNDARRFLARHPSAVTYAGFGDFGFYRMEIGRAHFVGGFARATQFSFSDFIRKIESKKFALSEQSLLGDLNETVGLVDTLVNRLLGRKGKGWKAVGVDAEGLDLRRGGGFTRLEFDRPVSGPAEILPLILELAN